MSLTRKLLKGMGLTDEQIDTIIENHSDTVGGLKDQLQEYKDEAEKLPGIQKALDKARKDLEDAKKNDYQEKYEQLEKEFEEYKENRANEDTHRAKVSAYRKLLKDAGISEKRIDAVMKVSDVDKIELDKDGNIKNADKLTEDIKSEWSDFIPTTDVKGAETPKPPANTGGTVKTKEEILKIPDPVKRQAEIADNIELFEKKGD